MDYRMIINEVRAALEEKAAREMYGSESLTLIAELEAEAATGLTAIQSLIDGMARQRRLYIANGMREAVADPNIPIGGTFSRARWLEIQEAFDAFEAWLSTPLPECGLPPLVIVSRRGNPPEQEQP